MTSSTTLPATSLLSTNLPSTVSKSNQGKTLSLVLGSGGAKGIAHIGVIRCLEEHGYDIRYVAGSSIGSIIGGVYAAGKLEAFADWVCALKKRDVLRLLDFSFSKGAIFKGDRIIDVLRDLIGECQIQDLPIGYTAVATDIARGGKGNEIWFNEGSLYQAMRASMAVPSFFSPVIIEGRVLVDGGIINPVPVAPTLNDRTDITIAVDLNGPYDRKLDIEPPEEEKPVSPLLAAYEGSIGQFLDQIWPDDASDVSDEPEQLGASDVMLRSMEAMQAAITQFKLAATVPTHIIEIPCNLCSFLDFHRAEELIEIGYQHAQELLKEMDEAER